jgi:hypothetical protein
VLEIKVKKGEQNPFMDSEEFVRQLLRNARTIDKYLGLSFQEPRQNTSNREFETGSRDVDGKQDCPPEFYDRINKLNFGFNDSLTELIGSKFPNL